MESERDSLYKAIGEALELFSEEVFVVNIL